MSSHALSQKIHLRQVLTSPQRSTSRSMRSLGYRTGPSHSNFFSKSDALIWQQEPNKKWMIGPESSVLYNSSTKLALVQTKRIHLTLKPKIKASKAQKITFLDNSHRVAEALKVKIMQIKPKLVPNQRKLRKIIRKMLIVTALKLLLFERNWLVAKTSHTANPIFNQKSLKVRSQKQRLLRSGRIDSHHRTLLRRNTS